MHFAQALAATGVAPVVWYGTTTFLVIALFLSIFWVWMLIDCLMSSLPPVEKLIWFLVIFFLHILGAVLYYFLVRSGGSRPRYT